MTANPASREHGPLHVVFRAERDVAGWATRHRLGEVPDLWPYGLDRLAREVERLTPVSLPAPGLAVRAVSRVVPAGVRAAVAGRRRTVSFSWDENTAGRMLAAHPSGEMFSGAIWVTDELATASPSYARRMRRVLGRMRGLVVLGSAQVAPLREFLGSGAPAIDFVRFGVDAEFWSATPYPRAPLVVSVGGDRDRDAGTLFAALELVRSARPDVEVIVQSASTLQAPPGVTKVARLSHRELQELYGRASVVAIATRPNLHASGITVALESMATARPVVLTRTAGLDDYFTHGETVEFVPPRDPSAMAQRILALLADGRRSAELGSRARARVEERFTTAHLAERLASVMRLGPAGVTGPRSP